MASTPSPDDTCESKVHDDFFGGNDRNYLLCPLRWLYSRSVCWNWKTTAVWTSIRVSRGSFRCCCVQRKNGEALIGSIWGLQGDEAIFQCPRYDESLDSFYLIEYSIQANNQLIQKIITLERKMKEGIFQIF